MLFLNAYTGNIPLPPASFADAVVAWHRAHGRKDLPWQQRPTRYRVWVSEIMLQQTQVAKVIPYFERFTARLPDVPALAAAPLDEVLQLWSGLGYYARARNLHRAAVIVRDNHGAQLPMVMEALRSLPGIGRSTAGAILSLAGDQRQPILDGNVKRVLTRHFAVAGWPGQASVAQRLWSLAEEMTPPRQVACYNQAMMDLGATVCTRSQPDCGGCPLAETCVARATATQRRYPTPRPRPVLPVKTTRMLMVRNSRGELLMQHRPPTGIWGGLWSLPECPVDIAAADWCRERLGIDARPLEIWPVRRHTFSHFHLDITPVEMWSHPTPACVTDGESLAWHPLPEGGSHGHPAPVSRLLNELHDKLTGEST